VRMALVGDSADATGTRWRAAQLMRAGDLYTTIDGSRIRSFDATTGVTLGEQHGGTISVDSRVGEFTEFTVRLPRVYRAAMAEAAS
jgi:signal transduction histidine kinase